MSPAATKSASATSRDRKSTRLNSIHVEISYAVFCLKKKTDWYEREVWDMFGIEFEGHPRLKRLLMPPTWQGHPLRKDYPARATEFDHYALSAGKQDLEQEALRFRPEDWGMKRGGENEDFMFLNLGPFYTAAHAAVRNTLSLHGALPI